MSNEKRVIRTERIWLKPNPRLKEFCHLSKNLYNKANYFTRKAYFNDKSRLKTKDLIFRLNEMEEIQKLSEPTAQRILSLVERTWKSFFRAMKDWQQYPNKYYRKPNPPRYKKKNGEYILPLTKKQFQCIKKKIIFHSPLNFEIKTRISPETTIIGARIIPQGIGYVLELLYLKNVPSLQKRTPIRIAGIDLGIENLITLVNNIGVKPIVVKGGVVKSLNQYYSKKRANLQRIYAHQGVSGGNRLFVLNAKRKRKINHYFHEVSRFIVNWCQYHQIDTIIIGKNPKWKYRTDLGKRVNQNFTSIRFDKLLHKISYKAQDLGICVRITNEYYTSKCSFLDNEKIGSKKDYQGKRIFRGLFCTRKGIAINSDVNGGYNIIKKEVPNAFSLNENSDGIEGVWLHPIRWKSAGQPAVL